MRRENGRDSAHEARHGVEALELGLALHVEAAYPGRERGAHLGLGLAHAREEDAIGAAACGEHARELPARDDVEAGAQARECVEDGEVGVRLDRVAHEVLDAREALVELAKGRFDHRARIHVARSAEAPRDLGKRDAVQRSAPPWGKTDHSGSPA